MNHQVIMALAALVLSAFPAQAQGQASSNSSEPNAKCITAGFMCRNCNTVAACIENPGGILSSIDVINCPGSCRNGICEQNAVCNYRPFSCSIGETGPFPDPYDCTKFHICSGSSTTPTTKICPVDLSTGSPSAYGSVTGSCRYPTDGNPNCINAPVPRCQKNLDVGVLPTDPNIYYICTQSGSSLAPNLYKCPPATAFNVSSFVCA